MVVDDSEMNRSILADMLGDEYDIAEAENGKEAVTILQMHREEYSLVLLDIVMPEMDGFGVLEIMKENGWIQDLPVIMISAESGSAHVERPYELGVTDFISRPFDALIVHRRVVNTIFLYTKQKNLENLVAEQIYEKEKQSSLMIEILGHIVEFRNGESGQHVRSVRVITELLLEQLAQKADCYNLDWNRISMITTASALHDIGKIAIPEEILNKPGRLTKEEFDTMKTHSQIGANMLEELPFYQDEEMVKVAYEICRWHHERYDGKGYPDGLKGDDIPISAQVVSVADVYDALTSERAYKGKIPHEKAMEMILNGECGSFSPLLLECLTDISPTLKKGVNAGNLIQSNHREREHAAREMLHYRELTASERTLHLLEHERMKYVFFAALTKDIQFEYTTTPPMVTLTGWGAEKLGLEEIVMDPLNDPRVKALAKEEDWQKILRAIRSATPKNPMITQDLRLNFDNEQRWFQVIIKTTWTQDEPPLYTGFIGKAMDIHDSRVKLNNLEQMATHDSLTGLVNHASAKKQITERIALRPDSKYALAIFDLDFFKQANDNYGHLFGDRLLIYIAEKALQSIRSSDIAVRVGGDEFLIFFEYQQELEPVVKRIYGSLTGQFENFQISISMGIAESEVVGTDYEEMFHAADQALYSVKRSGKGRYRFYNASLSEMLSAISNIEGGDREAAIRYNKLKEGH